MGVIISEAYVGGLANSTTSTISQIFPLPASMNSVTTPTATVLRVPGSGKLNGIQFRIVISVTILASASMNVTPILYSGTSLTPGSNTIIATGTAFATGGAGTFPMRFIFDCEGDTASGFLQGTQSQQANNTFVAPTASGVTKLTGLNFNTSDPVLSMVFGLTFATAGVNVGTLTQFSLEA